MLCECNAAPNTVLYIHSARKAPTQDFELLDTALTDHLTQNLLEDQRKIHLKSKNVIMFF